ncbi:MAG: VWA domain-containing protein [Oligoflexales bacterium]|nr:VWA domain-containing protein [Oligoflexales bacterium]
MNFLYSEYLLLLWLVPLLGLGLFLEMKQIRKRLLLFASKRLEELLNASWNRRLSLVKGVLLISSLVFLVLALARPRWGYEWKDLPKGGQDIIVAIDLSSSMLATDISPSRIERAKREMIDLISMLEGDRIGIVAFAGVAFMHSPLTVDYRMAQMFVSQLSTTLIPVQGTAIGEALRVGLDSLEKAASPLAQSKSLILITDGEDQGQETLKEAERAARLGYKIFAIGIGGQEGAPIPLPDGGFKKDAQGQLILSKLDEGLLQKITQMTGGIYVRSSSGDFDLQRIYRQGIRAAVEPQVDAEELDSTGNRQKVWIERFPIFLIIALLLLILEFFLRETKKKLKDEDKLKGLVQLSLLFLMMLVSLGAQNICASPASDGQDSYQKKEYDRAAQSFLKAEIEDPDNLNHAYNRAVSQFQNGDYEEAKRGFEKASQSADKKLAAKALYNLGNTQVALGKLPESVAVYDEALKIEPTDKDSLENRQWVQKQIEKKKNEKNDKKDDKQDKKEDKKDDKQDSKNEPDNKDKKDEQSQDKPDGDKQKPEQEQSKSEKEKQNESKQKGSEDKKGANDSKKDEQGSQDGKEQKRPEESEDKPKEDPPRSGDALGDKKGSQGSNTPVNKETAEKLLRMLEDQEDVYGIPPQFKKPRTPQEKDW